MLTGELIACCYLVKTLVNVLFSLVHLDKLERKFEEL